MERKKEKKKEIFLFFLQNFTKVFILKNKIKFLKHEKQKNKTRYSEDYFI